MAEGKTRLQEALQRVAELEIAYQVNSSHNFSY